MTMGKAMSVLDTALEYANHNFYNGLSCSESVFEALLRSGAVDESDAPLSACAMCAGFGGGVGLRGLMCGALSGAIMAIGAKTGRKDPRNAKPDGLYDLEYLRFNNVAADFEQVMGSALCDDITKPYQAAWGGPERKDHCAKAVAAATEIACRYLDLTTEELKEKTWGKNVAGN